MSTHSRTAAFAATLAAVSILMSVSCERKDVGNGSENGNIDEISTAAQLENVLVSSGDTLLIFDLYAEWCMPCRVLAPVLEKIAVENRGRVKMFRVDVDKLPALAQALGVRNIPFVLFVRNGEAIYAITGVHPREAYEHAINEFTPQRL
jgi:thioredoxin 1